jgi:FtsP/CotA-like multicopper oxidase with cupredoxin domain
VFLLLAASAHAAVVPFTLDLRDWVVDYQRPTIEPRLAPYKVPADAKMDAVLANNVFPGPILKCNQGDTINVTVVNNLIYKEVGITWNIPLQHGPSQRISPQGGVGNYILAAPKAGTFSWQSTDEIQAASGLQGGIVVQNQTAVGSMEERIMVLADARQRPNLCFDAKGTWDERMCGNIEKATLNGQWGDGSKGWPSPVIEVKQGACYLMRFIAFGPLADTTFEVSIKDHEFSPAEGAPAVSSMKVTPNAASGQEAVLCAKEHPVLDHDYQVMYSYSVSSQKQTFSAILRYA